MANNNFKVCYDAHFVQKIFTSRRFGSDFISFYFILYLTAQMEENIYIIENATLFSSRKFNSRPCHKKKNYGVLVPYMYRIQP